jgi:RHS repeat-associated protein
MFRNPTYPQSKLTCQIGKKGYELSNHLGNVLSVISDKAIPHDNGGVVDYFLADIRQAQDFSPFGVQLKGRNLIKRGNTELYRSGFQGQEEDDEMKGDGNSVNYTFRMHDPRLGRFFAVDPLHKDFPWNSTFAFSENKTINARELEGAEADECFDFKVKKRHGLGIISAIKRMNANRDWNFPKIKLITKEIVNEQTIICMSPVNITQPSAGQPFNGTLSLNISGTLQINYNMNFVPDNLVVKDMNTGNVNQFPNLSHRGTVNIPVTNPNTTLNIQVFATADEKNPNNPTTGTEYTLNMNIVDIRVFTQATYKFLGIRYKQRITMASSARSQKMMNSKNADGSPAFNISEGTGLMEDWQSKNGPVPCNPNPVSVQNNGQAIAPVPPPAAAGG